VMSTKREVIGKLKRILEEIGIEYSNILLFGSRARKDFEEDSDWDFMIILRDKIDTEGKRGLWYEEEEKRVVNTISNEVYLEGIEV